MKMLSERIRHLIDKRTEGACDPLELQELEEWYASHSRSESEIESALSGDVEASAQLRSSIYSAIRQQLDLASGEPELQNPVVDRDISFVRRWWKQSLAACAVMLLVAGIVLYQSKRSIGNDSITVSTKKDEATKIVLPDSSVVWLKPGSSVRYDPELGEGTTRDLYLEGEGFFDIAHDANSPFVVHVKDLDIKVLGTVFNVRSRSDNDVVETTLFKGSVRIEKRNDKKGLVTLTPNQCATYKGASQRMEVRKLPTQEPETGAAQVTANAHGLSMTFDERPFTELLFQMEKKFGVKIYIQNRYLLTCPITADLEQEGLVDILNLLKMGYGVDYTLYGKELFIEGAICNQ